VQTENEKAVRTPMREAFEQALAKRPDARFWNTTDAMFWAWQAALQSQPSNTDGWVMVPVEPTQAMHDSWMYGKGPWSERYRAMLAAAPKAPQQQEQSGAADEKNLVIAEAQEFEAYALEIADKPLDGASQESAPGQEAVVEAVARVFRDPELGVRVEWLIEGGAGACLDQVLLASPTKLTNDEGYGTVYLATPTSTAIAASSPSNKIAEQHEPGS
jgi:hypothetical protein